MRSLARKKATKDFGVRTASDPGESGRTVCGTGERYHGKSAETTEYVSLPERRRREEEAASEQGGFARSTRLFAFVASPSSLQRSKATLSRDIKLLIPLQTPPSPSVKQEEELT